jgi:pilus assembly protein CpaE
MIDGNARARETGLTALLISPDRDLAQLFHATLPETRAFEVLADLKAYPSQSALDIRLRQLKPDAVLIDVSSDLEAACEVIRFAAALQPPVLVVGLHKSNDSAVVVKVLRSGATEFLYAPFDPAIQREALARLRRLREPEPTEQRELGRVILFTSAKPGSGSSTLATHTAHAIRKSTGKRVLLCDLDLEGGTIGFYLKLQAKHCVADALDNADSLDAGLWANLAVSAGGVDVLTAPDHPLSDPVDPARLHNVIDYARYVYDWVIIDAPVIFHRTALAAISESDQAYVVSTSDLASLHLARKAINLLVQVGFSKDRYQMIINRLSRRDGIGGSDIEKIFNCQVYASLPNDYFALHKVISLGQALAPDCELGKAIASLAARVSGAGTADRKTARAAAEPRAALMQT